MSSSNHSQSPLFTSTASARRAGGGQRPHIAACSHGCPSLRIQLGNSLVDVDLFGIQLTHSDVRNILGRLDVRYRGRRRRRILGGRGDGPPVNWGRVVVVAVQGRGVVVEVGWR
jgi:hypothetical protein